MIIGSAHCWQLSPSKTWSTDCLPFYSPPPSSCGFPSSSMLVFTMPMSLPSHTSGLCTLSSGILIVVSIRNCQTFSLIYSILGSTCEENAGLLCSNPSANITLTHHKQLLQSNQPYKIILDLELPESETNKHVGMFMVQVINLILSHMNL